MKEKEPQQNGSIVPMCIVTPDGTIQFCNETLINTLGRNSNPIIGHKCREIFKCNPVDAGHCPLSMPGTSLHRHSSSSIRHSTYSISETAVPMFDSSGNVTAILLSFLSNPQSPAISPNLIKLQKLETIAKAAGGIVHDLNNIFMGLAAEIYILKETMGTLAMNSDIDQTLSSILKVISRGQGLTHHILQLNKGQQPETTPMPIGEIIKETVNFSLLNSRIQPIIRISDNLNLVKTNGEQIFQLLSNLVMNARHATAPDSGREITITADNLSEEEAEQIALIPCKYVRITVEDQGHGIPATDMQHIFEPFYTTKSDGTGLGLSLVSLIVKDLSGHITVESTPGKGSKFTVFIPALDLKAIPCADNN